MALDARLCRERRRLRLCALPFARSPGGIFNVGEEHTPTIAERLAKLPPSSVPANTDAKFNFEQNVAYDTTRIRSELGYREMIEEDQAMEMTLKQSRG